MTDHHSTSDHELLRQYEQQFRDNRITAGSFIKQLKAKPAVALQMELVAIEVELTLRTGEIPDPERLMNSFPDQRDEVGMLFVKEFSEFVKTFCPVRHYLGPLPQTLGGYRIEKEIGRGGMGVVYRALQESLSRDVALKIPFFTSERLVKEAKSLAALNHPGICRVYDAGQAENLTYMAMQLIEGQVLSSLIGDGKWLTPTRAVTISAKIADSMDYAHGVGVAHLDIKPGNVLITANDEPVLTDFGLSHLSTGGPLTVLGSPGYMAPEKLGEQLKAFSALSDIYSLGIILYEMMTGRRAFSGESGEIAEQILHHPPRRPSDYRDEIDPWLEDLCLTAISRSPENRFRTMREFHDELQDWLDNRSRYRSATSTSTTPVVDVEVSAAAEVVDEADVRVLIVDDHPLMREALALRISLEPNWKVCGETSREENAFKMIQELQPDLVLIDIRLAEGNGLSLLQRITDSGSAVKTLVVSGHDNPAIAEQALRAGAMGYVEKHDTNESINHALRSVLEGQRYLSPQLSQRLIDKALGSSLAQSISSATSTPTHEPENIPGPHLPPKQSRVSKRSNVDDCQP